MGVKAYLGSTPIWEVPPGWLGLKGDKVGIECVAEAVAITANSGNSFARQLHACEVDGNGKIAAIYRLGSSSGAIKVAIGGFDFANREIDWGTPVQEKASGAPNAGGLSIDAMSASKIILSYRTSSAASTGQIAATYTVAGNVPTFDATLTVNSTANTSETNEHFQVNALSGTRAAAFYWDGTNRRMDGLTAGSGTLVADGSSTGLLLNNASGSSVQSGGQLMPSLKFSASSMMLGYYANASTSISWRQIDDSGTALSFNNSGSMTGNSPVGTTAIPFTNNEFIVAGMAKGGTGGVMNIIDNQSGLGVILATGSQMPAVIMSAAKESAIIEDGWLTFPVLRFLTVRGVSKLVVQGYGINIAYPQVWALSAGYVEIMETADTITTWATANWMLGVTNNPRFCAALFRNASGYFTGKVVEL